MLPNFLVIGAMKCATSTICAFLEEHPDVYFLPNAEPDFFSHDDRWREGFRSYEALFGAAADKKMIGEGSNSYSLTTTFPETPSRIRTLDPKMRLIYSVRHPVERIASAWAQIRAQSPGEVSHDINEAVRSEPFRAEIIEASFYGRHLKAYLDQFPAEQIWIGFLEELRADQHAFLVSLCDFLGIDAAAASAHRATQKNRSEARPIMGPDYDKLRTAPGAGLLARLVPPALKALVKKRLQTPTPSIPELMARLDLPAEIRSALREDSAFFLAHTGRRSDLWSF